MMRSMLCVALVCCGLLNHAAAADSLTLVVMDPLSEPLSCDCVQGYAQRKYAQLGKYLSKKLDRKVQVVWHESLVEAIKETGGKADIVIGKHSVVLHDAKQLGRKMDPIARLSGRTGDVNQQGLIVVRAADTAKKISDLDGYRIFFGPVEAEEKSAAPMALLRKERVPFASKIERFGACSEAAIALLKLPADARAAAVISSYAEPLLEGCGSVKKGDLRVLARTKDVPFITAFIPADTTQELRQEIDDTLQLVSTDPELLRAMESLAGFEPWKAADAGKKK